MPVTLNRSTYYPIGEAAELVGRHRTTLWRWRKQKKIPPGLRYCDQMLLFTEEEVGHIYAHAHRLQPDEARRQLQNQLHLFAQSAP